MRTIATFLVMILSVCLLGCVQQTSYDEFSKLSIAPGAPGFLGEDNFRKVYSRYSSKPHNKIAVKELFSQEATEASYDDIVNQPGLKIITCAWGKTKSGKASLRQLITNIHIAKKFGLSFYALFQDDFTHTNIKKFTTQHFDKLSDNYRAHITGKKDMTPVTIIMRGEDVIDVFFYGPEVEQVAMLGEYMESIIKQHQVSDNSFLSGGKIVDELLK